MEGVTGYGTMLNGILMIDIAAIIGKPTSLVGYRFATIGHYLHLSLITDVNLRGTIW